MVKKTIMCDGNRAAAHAVRLCKPEVIPVYPITPQSPLVEKLCEFKANDLLDADIIKVEGENSALSAAIGASAAGGRVFTATSSWGLAFMYDCIMQAAGQRVPVVMVEVTRETPHHMAVLGSHQDLMTVKNTGWVIIVAESIQEIFDAILAAYRLSEDPRILLPVMVVYDGFYLSHLTDRLELPHPESVDRFLEPVNQKRAPVIDGENPMGFFSSCTNYGHLLTEYRFKHQAALDRVPVVWEDIRNEFKKEIGHDLFPMVESYGMEDAETAVVTMGSTAGTAKEFIDQSRESGKRIGLLRVVIFRPWPGEDLVRAMQGLNGLGVLDRSLALGLGFGDLYLDILSSQARFGSDCPVEDFICGFGSADVTLEHFDKVSTSLKKLANTRTGGNARWLDME